MNTQQLIEQMEKEFDKLWNYEDLCCGGDMCDKDNHRNDLQDIKSFFRSFATRIVEEVGRDLIGELEKHHEKSMCTGCGEDLACDYEEVYEIIRTKLQKMKGSEILSNVEEMIK